MEEQSAPAAARQEEPSAIAPAHRSGSGIGWRIAVLLLIAVAIGATAWVWVDARGRIGATQEELARRLRDIENVAREAQEGTREIQGRMVALEGKLADAQRQQAALEARYQALSLNSDEWQIAEIEQVLAIAAQQLQLSGNVSAALHALQLAENRLSRADRAQFLPVRRALARDIERLKSLPALDIADIGGRLDELLAAVDALPLVFEGRVAAAPGEAPRDEPQGAVARFGAGLWQELKQLVVLRRVDVPAPPLLAPTQAYFLRENLRLRLLNARFALLARHQAAYLDDLRAAQTWLQRYFDTRAVGTQAALAHLTQMLASPVSFEPPGIADSLDAVRGFKARRDRSSG